MLNTIKNAITPHTSTTSSPSIASTSHCTTCHTPTTNSAHQYCPHCGTKLSSAHTANQSTPTTTTQYDVTTKAVWRRLGILGGGQLGRMMIDPCRRLNIHTTILDPSPTCSAHTVADKHIVGNFRDAAYIQQLAQQVDVLTVEIEHVDATAIAQHGGNIVQPTVDTIQLIQDKFVQKQHLQKYGIALGNYTIIQSKQDIHNAIKRFSLPLMLKSRLLAYDGKGNYVVKSDSDIDNAISTLTKSTQQTDGAYMLYAEQWVEYTMELAVMVVRSVGGEVRSYPTVQTIQHENVCHLVIAPAPIDANIQQQARTLAEHAISTMSGAGIYGVELFLLPGNQILLNEIAPRPHNSGHYTIEACVTSQFENHVRAVMNLPLGSTAMRVNHAVMINVLGTGTAADDVEKSWLPCAAAMECGGAVHWYAKEGCALKRKIGHITFTGNSQSDLHKSITLWQHAVDRLGKQYSVTHTNYIHSPVYANQRPVVGIIMGSDSDLPKMSAAADMLEQFGIAYELTVVSAHRTPDRLVTYARTARDQGLQCIIAGAGGAAHLPGMIAAMTSLPVIGVPVPLTHLDGVDSLYSIVQMPRGVPVATVAIGNSTNAGLLAARVLATSDAVLYERLMEYQTNMTAEVNGKIDAIAKSGWREWTQRSKH